MILIKAKKYTTLFVKTDKLYKNHKKLIKINQYYFFWNFFYKSDIVKEKRMVI